MENKKYNILVNFEGNDSITSDPITIVKGDYNSVDFEFQFNKSYNLALFFLIKPNGKEFVTAISENKLTIDDVGIFDVVGKYQFGVSIYDENSKLTIASKGKIIVVDDLSIDSEEVKNDSNYKVLDDLVKRVESLLPAYNENATAQLKEFNDLVDIKIKEYNEKTNELLSNGLNGSPLVASSIEEMVDTTRVYVNTTDGHWYYYNEIEWIDGGVYQAIELENGSVTHQKLDNNITDDMVLNSAFEKGYKYNYANDSLFEQGSIVLGTGEVGDSTSSSYLKRLRTIDFIPETTEKLVFNDSKYSVYVVFYNKNDNTINSYIDIKTTYIFNHDDYRYKIVLKKNDETEIGLSEIKAISLLGGNYDNIIHNNMIPDNEISHIKLTESLINNLNLKETVIEEFNSEKDKFIDCISLSYDSTVNKKFLTMTISDELHAYRTIFIKLDKGITYNIKGSNLSLCRIVAINDLDYYREIEWMLELSKNDEIIKWDDSKECDISYKNTKYNYLVMTVSTTILNENISLIIRRLGVKKDKVHIIDNNYEINTTGIELFDNNYENLTLNPHILNEQLYHIYFYNDGQNRKLAFITLTRGKQYRININNAEKIRIALFKELKEDIRTSEYNADIGHTNLDFTLTTKASKVLLDTSETSLSDFIINNEDYKTLAIYLAKCENPTLSVLESDLVINERKLVDDIKVAEINLEKKLLDLINHEDYVSDLSIIQEFNPFETDYSTNIDGGRTLDMSSDEFLAKFYDKYMGYHSDGMRVIKKSLGLDQSNTYDLWQFDFKPKDYKYTILLSSGMHTYELPASFGLAKWIEYYMTSTEETFVWLRKYVRILCIPIVNPWGFNQTPKRYPNVNGVNINRNFNDWNNVWESFPVYSSNPEDSNYNEWNVKGSEPFSEAETRILRDWLYEHNDALFWIDCHIGLWNYNGENWIIYVSSSPYVEQITTALEELENRIATVYGTTPKSLVNVDGQTSIKHRFSTDVAGIPSMTIEQSHSNNSYGSDVNNEAIKITEYATTIHAYVVSMLKGS